MKLIETYHQPPITGFPSACHEWWNIGDGYKIYIDIGEKSCGIAVYIPNKDNITWEVAKYLGVDTNLENITFGGGAKGRELYLSAGIDCVVLNYTKPENYKELLNKIEEIVNKYFKNR